MTMPEVLCDDQFGFCHIEEGTAWTRLARVSLYNDLNMTMRLPPQDSHAVHDA